MKNIRRFTFAIILFPLATFSQNIQATVDFAQFQRGKDSNLFDIYLDINGSSLIFKENENKKLQANVALTLFLEDKEGIQYVDKMIVNSVEITDTTTKPNLFTLKSFYAKKGDYTLNVKINDLNARKDGITSTIPVKIETNESLKISDIVFLSSYEKSEDNNDYVKNGIKMIPKHSHFFPKNQKTMSFYLEVYNLDTRNIPDEKLLITFKIQDANNYRIFPAISSFTKISSASVVPVLKELNIEKLPSGNFNLLLEIRDSTNSVVYTKTKFFQRSSDIKLEDINKDLEQQDINNISIVGTFVENIPDSAVRFQLRAIRPLATKREQSMIDFLVKNNDADLQRRYMLHFWEKRGEREAETKYKDFVVRLAIAEKKYSTRTFRSFETDRGRVFLQYGQPNRIDDEINQFRRTAMANSSPIPYETWHYFNIDAAPTHVAQTKRLFVFVEDNRGNNAWRLVHSNALGEITNEAWINDLSPNNVNELNLPINRGFDDR